MDTLAENDRTEAAEEVVGVQTTTQVACSATACFYGYLHALHLAPERVSFDGARLDGEREGKDPAEYEPGSHLLERIYTWGSPADGNRAAEDPAGGAESGRCKGEATMEPRAAKEAACFDTRVARNGVIQEPTAKLDSGSSAGVVEALVGNGQEGN